MTRWAYLLGASVAIGGLAYVMRDALAPAPPRLPSIEQGLLDAARGTPEDAGLGMLFDQLNVRHFGGTLPNADVMWSSGLDRLDRGEYRLNGMTDGRVILLKSALKDDADTVKRTLCHEMVHVRFLAAGNTATTHDAVFQAELRRIFEEGCFEAILAPPEEQATLKAWIDTERSRLDAARLRATDHGAAVKADADAVERTFAELNERIRLANAAGSGWPTREETDEAERRRTDSNNSVLAYNASLAAIERDQVPFNEAVRRYNLMLAYPDGLAEDRAKGLIR